MKNKKILVVENNKMLQTAIVKKLRTNGFSVIATETAEEGLLLLGKRPNIIWLDIYLPWMNGYDSLEKKESGEFKDIHVIMVTCSVSASEKAWKSDTYVDAFFLKNNINLDDIVSKARSIISYEKYV